MNQKWLKSKGVTLWVPPTMEPDIGRIQDGPVQTILLWNVDRTWK